MAGRALTRRQFLRRAGGGAGVVAVAVGGHGVLHPLHGPPAHADASTGAQGAQRSGPRYGAFFNETDAATVEAIAERIMPGAPGMPGARDAGVLNYIDLALAGAYADLQYFYRQGLAALDAYSESSYGRPFRQLGPDQQDAVLGALDRGEASGFTWPTAQAFFNTLRTHTMEGLFADPLYGGNKEFAGWRLVGFPGAQPFFLPTDLQSAQPFSRAPVRGLQQAGGATHGGGE